MTLTRSPVRAFGLLEVIISATLLITALAGILSFSAHASTVAGHQRHMTVASHIAEVQMEKLLQAYGDDARLGHGSHSGPAYDDVANPVAGGDYTTSWVIIAGTPIAGARTVIVTVAWKESTGPKTTSLRTIRT